MIFLWCNPSNNVSFLIKKWQKKHIYRALSNPKTFPIHTLDKRFTQLIKGVTPSVMGLGRTDLNIYREGFVPSVPAFLHSPVQRMQGTAGDMDITGTNESVL